MTETLPARVPANGNGATYGRRGSPGYEVDLVAIARQAEAAKALGETLIASGFLPDSIKKPEQAVAVIIKGQELQIPPMHALSHINVIKGKPTMSAELMRALAQRAGHKIRVIETTADSATVEGVRADDPGHPTRITFDEEDVKRAGLQNQAGHKNYPAPLKLARATSALCRALFADAIGGISYTPEELGADVDEEGRVVEGGLGGVPYRGSNRDDSPATIQEAEVVESSAEEDPEPDHSEAFATREQVDTLMALSDQLFDDKDATLSGPEWLQEQLGKPFSDLTRSRAAALIEKYGERLNGDADGE